MPQTPIDDDNYGKGYWNRPRADEVDYREKLGKVLAKPCNRKSRAKIVKQRGAKTTYSYG